MYIFELSSQLQHDSVTLSAFRVPMHVQSHQSYVVAVIWSTTAYASHANDRSTNPTPAPCANKTRPVQVQTGIALHLQVFGHFADSLEGVIGSGVGALVRVDE